MCLGKREPRARELGSRSRGSTNARASTRGGHSQLGPAAQTSPRSWDRRGVRLTQSGGQPDRWIFGGSLQTVGSRKALGLPRVTHSWMPHFAGPKMAWSVCWHCPSGVFCSNGQRSFQLQVRCHCIHGACWDRVAKFATARSAIFFPTRQAGKGWAVEGSLRGIRPLSRSNTSQTLEPPACSADIGLSLCSFSRVL